MKKLCLLSLMVIYIALVIFKDGPITINEAIWLFMLIPLFVAIFFLIIEVILSNRRDKKGRKNNLNTVKGKISRELLLIFATFLLSGICSVIGSNLPSKLSPGYWSIAGIALFIIAIPFCMDLFLNKKMQP